MAKACATRREAEFGIRSKSHYYLFSKSSRYFTVIPAKSKFGQSYSVPASLYVNISTWGPSR